MSTPAERRFYASKRWRSVRAQVVWKCSGLCVKCKAVGVVKPGTEVDHIMPLKERPDLALTPSNLQLLCHDCHTRKTRSDLNPAPRHCLHGYPEPTCPLCKSKESS